MFDQLHEVLLAELHAANQIDWSRAIADASHVRAKMGGTDTGPSPVDRGKTGSKHHLITDGGGIPLATILTGGNRSDVTQLVPLVEAIPPVRGRVGGPAASQRPWSPTAATTTSTEIVYETAASVR